MLLDKQQNRDLVDFVRTVAILAVFVFHVCFILGGLMEDDARARFIAAYPDIFSFIWQPFGVDGLFLVSR